MPYSLILKINWLKLWMIFQAHNMCTSSKQLFSLPTYEYPIVKEDYVEDLY